jgi:hypothetical protein
MCRVFAVQLADHLGASIETKEVLSIAVLAKAGFHVHPPVPGRAYGAKLDEAGLLTDVIRSKSAGISARGKFAATERPPGWLDPSSAGAVE